MFVATSVYNVRLLRVLPFQGDKDGRTLKTHVATRQIITLLS